jgi:hypothetical protein
MTATVSSSSFYIKADIFGDGDGDEDARIYVCPRCGGLVLGFGNSKIGQKQHKHCPPNPRFPSGDMELFSEGSS